MVLRDALRVAGAGAVSRIDVDLEQLRRQGEQGDLWAQFTLAGMHKNGEGVAQDFAEAARWYRMAAEGRHNSARYELGMLYLEGKGVPQDPLEAASCFYDAATGDHREAQRRFREIYAGGHGVPRDEEKARWFSHVVDFDLRAPWYWHGRMETRGMIGRTASGTDFSAGGGLLMMTGPADGHSCKPCLDQLGVVRTAEEWERITPEFTAAGLHDDCRCAWRRVTHVDPAFQEMQRTVMMQVDVQRWLRGIYWRPIVVLGKRSVDSAAVSGQDFSPEGAGSTSGEPKGE